VITAQVVFTNCRCRWIEGLSFEFYRASRTIESALDQTIRAQSRGIAGTQFLSALKAVWHLDQSRSTYSMPFVPDAVTFSAAIPYSWQVSRIRTGRLIEKLERTLTRI
jgi:hypothetical protein